MLRGVEPRVGAGRGANPFGSFFGGMGGMGGDPFGGRAQSPRPSAGNDVEATIELDFTEAIQGTTREIRNPNGTGNIKVNIPPAVVDAQTLRIAGKGGDIDRFPGAIGAPVSGHEDIDRGGRLTPFDPTVGKVKLWVGQRQEGPARRNAGHNGSTSPARGAGLIFLL